MKLKLTNTSQYLEAKGGTHWWRWTAFIQVADDADLDKIKYVEYQLHSSFKNPIKRVRNPSNGFALTMKGWGTFQLIARVVFEDDSQKPLLLNHTLQFIQSANEYNNL